MCLQICLLILPVCKQDRPPIGRRSTKTVKPNRRSYKKWKDQLQTATFSQRLSAPRFQKKKTHGQGPGDN